MIELNLIGLKEAYQEMADLTRPACKETCGLAMGRKYRCCEKAYCEFARSFAKENYNIVLEESKEYKNGTIPLPFMSESGCIVEPYLRPSCTLHNCDINSIGIKRNDPEFTNKYFELREKIDDLHMKEFMNPKLGEPHDIG